MGWPKTIVIRGVGVPVDSWEELDELVGRYGGEALIVAQGEPGELKVRPKSHGQGGAQLSPSERALLQQFVEAGSRGLLTTQIGPAVGKKGKGIRPALDRWSRRIGLVTEDGASAFEPVKRMDGRGFRMADVYIQGARTILGA